MYACTVRECEGAHSDAQPVFEELLVLNYNHLYILMFGLHWAGLLIKMTLLTSHISSGFYIWLIYSKD